MSQLLSSFAELMHSLTLLKLFLALGIGFIIGLEREIRKKSIGIRTCTVISVVSCLLTIISVESAFLYAEAQVRPMDPLRLPAQIVSGIGFIGAGVILRRSNNVVSGLTTAAIVWGVSGIGIAIGADFIIEAIIAVILIFVGVEVVPYILRQVGMLRVYDELYSIRISVEEDHNVEEIVKKIKEGNIYIHEMIIEDEDELSNIHLQAYVKRKYSMTDVYHKLKGISGVDKIKIE